MSSTGGLGSTGVVSPASEQVKAWQEKLVKDNCKHMRSADPGQSLMAIPNAGAREW